MTKMLNVIYLLKPIYRLTELYKLEVKHLHDGALKIADEVYDEKRDLQSKHLKNVKAFGEFDDENKKSRNFIETLMDPSNGLDEDEIKDEINTLVAAVSRLRSFINKHCMMLLLYSRVTKHQLLSFQTHF